MHRRRHAPVGNSRPRAPCARAHAQGAASRAGRAHAGNSEHVHPAGLCGSKGGRARTPHARPEPETRMKCEISGLAMPAWLTWTFVALLSWGVWAVLSKLLGDALTAEQSQAISTLGMLPIILPLALSQRAPLRGAS